MVVGFVIGVKPDAGQAGPNEQPKIRHPTRWKFKLMCDADWKADYKRIGLVLISNGAKVELKPEKSVLARYSQLSDHPTYAKFAM